MKKQNLNIAVYIDMENVASSEFVLEDVMNSFLSADDDYNCIFAIKAAYGNQARAKKSLKKQIVEHNFNIVDTPKIGSEKNRSDLILSLDAFESLYLDTPRIDRYCFMTSDADFTVIADKLRKFGKEVWLVCKKSDKDRAILTKSFDNLLFLDDFCPDTAPKVSNDIDRLFIQAVRNMNQSNLPTNVSVANDRMKAIDPSFRVTNTNYKTFMKLIKDMESKGYVVSETLDTGENRITEICV
ncbi:NYN domain-containing protein [Pseudoalteromonas sp. T1lg122]|uniref:NYN domain-containing protein n=1 Tax=Pseudoalteromonas sp. T1lg122 TaxID=2077094 RepID=UPI000CF671B1|nr:NYN domain-containing protein [Pseudoalteromonas sp. T1lg122]